MTNHPDVEIGYELVMKNIREWRGLMERDETAQQGYAKAYFYPLEYDIRTGKLLYTVYDVKFYIDYSHLGAIRDVSVQQANVGYEISDEDKRFLIDFFAKIIREAGDARDAEVPFHHLT